MEKQDVKNIGIILLLIALFYLILYSLEYKQVYIERTCISSVLAIIVFTINRFIK